MALELERTRELGLLRALGMTPAGLSGLLLVETGLTGLIASLISVPVGIGVAATLVYVLYERCFGWSMDLHIDPVIVAQGIALAVGAALLELEVTPRLPDQELDVSVRYWEGAVEARGTAHGLPVTGRGYLELTGYADE